MNWLLFVLMISCRKPFLSFPATVDSVNGRWVTVEIINEKGEHVLVETPTSYFPFIPKEGEQWYYRFVDCSRCEDIPIRTRCVVVKNN